MEDHDQRFKSLLKAFFAEFFQVFFPVWAKRFDFSEVEWLEQEVFPDPPRGERRSLDLVAKLRLVPGAPAPTSGRVEAGDRWVTLIHIEIESGDSVAPLRPRMMFYYEQLRRKHGLPVLPIALYLRVGLDGIGWDVYQETYWDHPLLQFHYAYVGLPGLDGERYVTGEHVLGVALTALMRVSPERRVAVHAEAMRRVGEAPENEYRRHLLLDCLEAYARLDEKQLRELAVLLETERYRGVQDMTATTYEKGLEKGLEKGVEKGQRTMLRKLVEYRFGPLSAGGLERLDSLGPEQLEALALELLKAQSLQELGLED